MTVQTIAPLPGSPVDVIGTVHGASEPLWELSGRLGYDAEAGDSIYKVQ